MLFFVYLYTNYLCYVATGYICTVCTGRTGEIITVVNPGELLLVPPFWFHHVETLEESVSLNVWSDAPEYILMNSM
jgi:hypothetical protein